MRTCDIVITCRAVGCII